MLYIISLLVFLMHQKNAVEADYWICWSILRDNTIQKALCKKADKPTALTYSYGELWCLQIY